MGHADALICGKKWTIWEAGEGIPIVPGGVVARRWAHEAGTVEQQQCLLVAQSLAVARAQHPDVPDMHEMDGISSG